MKYTKEEVFVVLLGEVLAVDGYHEKELERIYGVAKNNGLSVDKVSNALEKYCDDEYDNVEVLKCITNADEDFKDLLFFGCLRVIVADGEISTKEINILHKYADCYFDWSATYVTIKLLRLLKDEPELKIV